jgi:hypothetical protein
MQNIAVDIAIQEEVLEELAEQPNYNRYDGGDCGRH